MLIIFSIILINYLNQHYISLTLIYSRDNLYFMKAVCIIPVLNNVGVETASTKY